MSTLFFALAMAVAVVAGEPPLECYRIAMQHPRLKYEAALAVELCRGTRVASAPVTCVERASRHEDLQYNPLPSVHLCSGSSDPEAPVRCYDEGWRTDRDLHGARDQLVKLCRSR